MLLDAVFPYEPEHTYIQAEKAAKASYFRTTSKPAKCICGYSWSIEAISPNGKVQRLCPCFTQLQPIALYSPMKVMRNIWLITLLFFFLKERPISWINEGWRFRWLVITGIWDQYGGFYSDSGNMLDCKTAYRFCRANLIDPPQKKQNDSGPFKRPDLVMLTDFLGSSLLK